MTVWGNLKYIMYQSVSMQELHENIVKNYRNNPCVYRANHFLVSLLALVIVQICRRFHNGFQQFTGARAARQHIGEYSRTNIPSTLL